MTMSVIVEFLLEWVFMPIIMGIIGLSVLGIPWILFNYLQKKLIEIKSKNETYANFTLVAIWYIVGLLTIYTFNHFGF